MEIVQWLFFLNIAGIDLSSLLVIKADEVTSKSYTSLWHFDGIMLWLYGRGIFTHECLVFISYMEPKFNIFAIKIKIYCKYNCIKEEIVINCNSLSSKSSSEKDLFFLFQIWFMPDCYVQILAFIYNLLQNKLLFLNLIYSIYLLKITR